MRILSSSAKFSAGWPLLRAYNFSANNYSTYVTTLSCQNYDIDFDNFHFSTNITESEKVGNQKVLYFPTSPK